MIKKILKYILDNYIKLFLFKLKWRRANKHNFTTARNIFDLEKNTVGNFTYGPLCIHEFGENNSGLVIGNLCSIALDVKFITGGNHFATGVLTYPIAPMIGGGGKWW